MFRIITACAKRSKLKTYHPMIKIILCIFPIIIIGFTKGIELPLLNIIIFLILHIITKTPLKLVFKYSIGIMLFSLISSITFIVDYGYYYCIIVMLKTLSGVISMLYLCFTTPMDDVLLIISRYDSLRDLCDIAKTMERYIMLIEDDYLVLYKAIKSRGGFDNKKKAIKNSGRLLGLLFVNTMKRWGGIKDTLMSRCYTGVIPYAKKEFKRSLGMELLVFLYIIMLSTLEFLYY